jgi:hypothetical protein
MPPPAFAYGDAAYKAVAAGRRHACAVDAMGGLVCWGDGNPDVLREELPADMTAMALGHNTTCIRHDQRPMRRRLRLRGALRHRRRG